MSKRIYIVNGGEQPRLVRAGSRSAAISHVVKTTYSAAVASQDNIVTALGQGIKVEDAGAEDGEGEQP